MPRPSTVRLSSMTTAFVVVEPRSMPMKQRMATPSVRGGRGGRTLLLDHLEVALQPVLDVGRREVARIDEIGLDERSRLAGAPFHLAQDQELSRREAIAALDRVDQQAVSLVLLEVLADHVDARREIEIGVTAEAILRQRLDRIIGIVAKAEVVDAADLGVGRGDDDRSLVVEHFP